MAPLVSTTQKRGNVPWTRKTVGDLKPRVLYRPSLDFNERPGRNPYRFLESHHSQLFLQLYGFAKKTFAGTGNFTGKSSAWIHEYPEEFYGYVQAIARPDPRANHWEGLLRKEPERIFLIMGIIMKVLDAKVFSSLMFGASEKHEKALTTHDIDLINCDGFERSEILSRMNEAYLRESAGVSPFFWDQVAKITSQIAILLLPLYNVVGKESAGAIPDPETLIKDLSHVVSYAGWISVMTRLDPGITVMSWLAPGDEHQLGQVNALHEAFEHSKARAELYDRRQKGSDKLQKGCGLKRTGRVKINVTPRIEHYSLHIPKPGALKETRRYNVLEPHVTYYSGLFDPREDVKTLCPLSEYIRRVRDPWPMPPAPGVLFSAIKFILFFYFLYICHHGTGVIRSKDLRDFRDFLRIRFALLAEQVGLLEVYVKYIGVH